MFPILFNLGILGIASAQACALPLLLIPVVGKRAFMGTVNWTKDGFGRLLLLITILFGPTSLHISSSAPPSLTNPPLLERDTKGRITKVNLPDRLVIMANHQAYTDWMYLWILACYAGHGRGIIVMLKWSLRSIPILGWAMRAFRFIFMKRNWAADRGYLTAALRKLGKDARASHEKVTPLGKAPQGIDARAAKRTTSDDDSASTISGNGESDPLLLKKAAEKAKQASSRSPLWLLIFPEGTITSDEERVKSVRYAEKEGIPDLTTMLHPRSTGLLFCLRTLLPQIPDLQLLDVTIGYPGVPAGKYPQDYYGLGSIFFRGVPPPTVHIHLHLHTDLSAGESISGIPSLIPNPPPSGTSGASTPASDSTLPTLAQRQEDTDAEVPLATPDEARAFELWLRKQWIRKDERLKDFAQGEKYTFEEEKQGVEVFELRQVKWYHWLSAFGGGGAATVAAIGVAIWLVVTHARA